MNVRERTIIVREVEVFILRLNPVYSNAENTVVVAISYDYDRLVEFVKSFECIPYVDEFGYRRCYTGELSDFNSPVTLQLNVLSPFGEGIQSEWITENSDLSRYRLI